MRFLAWEATLSRIPRELIRWKFLAVTLGTAFVLLLMALVWHRYRLGRSAAEVLESARIEHRSGDPEKASKLFDAYLKLFPNDLAVRIERARAFDQQADRVEEKLRALELYQQALAAKKELAPLNARMSQIEFELGRDQKAILYAEAALAEEPSHPLAWKYKSMAQARRFVKQPVGAATDSLTSLETAAELMPDDMELIGTYAGALRREGEYWSTPAMLDKADAAIDRLIRLRPTDPMAWMARYAYRVKYKLSDASGDLDEALAHSPDDLESLLAFALHSRRSGELAVARQLFARAVETTPQSGRSHLGLAQTVNELGHRAEAVELARAGVKQTEGDPWLTLQLCEWLIDDGQVEPSDRMLNELSIRVLKAEQGLPPPQVQALQVSIRFLIAQGMMKRQEFAAAVGVLRPLTSAQPNQEQSDDSNRRTLQIRLALAECFVALQDWVQAGEEFDAASLMAPGATGPVLAAAQAWERALPERAMQRYERALAMDPNLTSARRRLAELRRAIDPGSGG